MRIVMIDVESDGLYGRAFAYAIVKAEVNKSGIRLIKAKMVNLGNFKVKSEWVKENVLPSLRKPLPLESLNKFMEEPAFINLIGEPKALRTEFWQDYTDFVLHDKDIQVWAGTNFPVETNFLSSVIKDNLSERQNLGPYPFYDLGTILDPNISIKEYTGVEYNHNPLQDCIASIYALQKVFNERSLWN